MTLDLHQKCQSQLKQALSEQLANATVRHGMFLSPITSAYLFLAQAVLPNNGRTHEKLKKLIGEAPLVDFVSGMLSRELYESQSYQTEEGPVALASIPAYKELAQVSSRLIDQFCSLPWRYVVTAPLPAEFSRIFCEHIKTIQLSESASIVCGDDALSKHFPLQSGVEKRDREIAGGGLLNALMIGSKQTWKPDTAYLQIAVEGFIGKYTTTEPLLDAQELLRSFFGLGLALRLFKPSYSHEPYPKRQRMYIHRRVDDKWEIEETHELEMHQSKTISDLKLHTLDGKLESDSQLASWMKSQLSSIGETFRAGDKSRNILLGSRWLLDSHGGIDELLQFVQAAVVVEILLGEKASSDLTGLGELLANRCAYLIATSHAERNELLQDFRKIYEVRSKIVHRGKSRLVLQERTLFGKLRWMCRRIIFEEVKLLEKDVQA